MSSYFEAWANAELSASHNKGYSGTYLQTAAFFYQDGVLGAGHASAGLQESGGVRGRLGFRGGPPESWPAVHSLESPFRLPVRFAFACLLDVNHSH